MARLAPALLAVLACALGSLAPARAEPANAPVCQRYRAELASLGDGASVTRALQSEIGRLQAYYRSLNCESGTFLFFDTRPPQCGAVEQRIRALNATYGGAASEDNTARRRQLYGLIAANCSEPARDPQTGEQTARGGPQVICVRTCDGAYFPMRNLPEGRGGADEMCQALCPGAEAAAYAMPHGDDALKYAAAVKGSRAYTALPNAFKFRTAFVPNCSCKPDGKTWAQSLAKAESMLVRHKGDIFVTPMQAEALSRPKIRLTLVGRADRTAAGLAADAAGRMGAGTAQAAEARGDAGKADGIKPDGAWADPVAQMPATAGPGAPAAERTVRLIAPEIVAIPQPAAP